MRISVEKVAQGKDLFPAQEIDMGDHEAKATGAKLGASDGEAAKGFWSVCGVANDSLDDLPGERWARRYDGRSRRV